MANEYLVDIHHFITEKIKESEKALALARDQENVPEQQFYNGKLHEFKRIRVYLNEHFNLITQVYY